MPNNKKEGLIWAIGTIISTTRADGIPVDKKDGIRAKTGIGASIRIRAVSVAPLSSVAVVAGVVTAIGITTGIASTRLPTAIIQVLPMRACGGLICGEAAVSYTLPSCSALD
jgi:hypothetical protein